MRLVTSDNEYELPSEWKERWVFLQDVHSDLGLDGVMTWTYTSDAMLRLWVDLNDAMDDEHTTTHSKVIPMSLVQPVVDFMQPATSEWLLYVHIDPQVQCKEREEAYKQLGKWVRTKGVRYPYAVAPSPTDLYILHENLALYLDPAYTTERPAVTHPEAAYQWLLNDDTFNIVTGIVHTGYYLQTVESFVPDPFDEYYKEVPWYLIPWSDLRMVRENYKHYFLVIDTCFRNEEGCWVLPSSQWDFQAEFTLLGALHYYAQGDNVGGVPDAMSMVLSGRPIDANNKHFVDSSSKTRVPVLDRSVVAIPHFPQFLQLYLPYYRWFGSTIGRLALVKNYVRQAYTVYGAIDFILSRMLAGRSVQQFCDTVTNTFGTSFLSTCLECTTSRLEVLLDTKTDLRAVYKKQYVGTMVEFKTCVCLTAELTGFQRWPHPDELGDLSGGLDRLPSSL